MFVHAPGSLLGDSQHEFDTWITHAEIAMSTLSYTLYLYSAFLIFVLKSLKEEITVIFSFLFKYILFRIIYNNNSKIVQFFMKVFKNCPVIQLESRSGIPLDKSDGPVYS